MSGCSAPKIGVLDSGIGGLSVLREIHRLLPEYPTLYVADQRHLPYGPRPLAEIHAYVDGITRFLRAEGAAVVVLACHAASAASLYPLRQTYPDFPFVGIEPAVKPAVSATRSGVVGVLTTQATADGPLYRRVLTEFAGQTRVLTRIAPELVTLAESEDVPEADALDIVRRYVAPLLAAGVDQIVLACTHFPFLAPLIQTVAGPHVALVDPGPAVARQVSRVLGEGGPLTPGPSPTQAGRGESEAFDSLVHPAFLEANPESQQTASAQAMHTYYTTADAEGFRAALRRLLGVDEDVQELKWNKDLSPL